MHRLPGTASFTFAGTSGEAVLLELERRGVVSSSGSACAAGSDEPSHVLVAMGIPPEVAQTAVRFTFSHALRELAGCCRRRGRGIRRRRTIGRVTCPRAPAVTVIVPGYNVAPYAAEALESLRAQTLRRLGRDPRRRRVDRRDRRDLRAPRPAPTRASASCTTRRQRGLGAARNTGSTSSRRPSSAFLDADDVLTPTALERLVGILDQTGSDFALGAYVRLRPDADGGYALGTVQPWVAAATDPSAAATTIDQHPEATGNIVAWSKVSRTEFWQRAGLRFPVGKLYEDQVVAQQMYARARRFDVIPDVVAHVARAAPTARRSPSARRSSTCCATASTAMDAGIARARIRRAPRRGAGAHRPDAADGHPARSPRSRACIRDAAYRRALGVFAREICGIAPAPPRGPRLDEASSTGRRRSARLW